MKYKNQITHELEAARSWYFHVRSFVGWGLLRHRFPTSSLTIPRKDDLQRHCEGVYERSE